MCARGRNRKALRLNLTIRSPVSHPIRVSFPWASSLGVWIPRASRGLDKLTQRIAQDLRVSRQSTYGFGQERVKAICINLINP